MMPRDDGQSAMGAGGHLSFWAVAVHKKVPSTTFTPRTKPLMLSPITAQAGQACTATGGNLGHG
jgi:hypothetical protein